MKRKLKKYEGGEEVQTGQGQPQGGGQDQIIQQVAQAIQQGAPVDQIVMQLMQQFQDPQAVAQILMQAGIPQEQVMQIMQQVMQQGQGEAPVEGQPAPEGAIPEGGVPAMAFGGPTDPPVDPATGAPVSPAASDFRGRALFPSLYGNVDWGTREATPGIPMQNRGWFDALALSMKTNKRIRQGYVDPNGVDYSQYAKVRPQGFVVNDAEPVGTFAFGGPINFDQILEEGGEALRASMIPKVGGYSKDNPETYVKDLQSTFASIVARNNVNANLNRNFEDLKNIFSAVPKAEGGISVEQGMGDLNITAEQYNDPKNLEYKNRVDDYIAKENQRLAAKNNQPSAPNNPYGQQYRTSLDYNAGVQYGQQPIPYTIPWSPYGQQNPNMQLNPFAQMLGAFQPAYGGMPNIRSRGDARGLEAAFMQNPMGGVSADGRQWSVSNVERRGLFKNKVRYNIQWDGTGTPPDPNAVGEGADGLTNEEREQLRAAGQLPAAGSQQPEYNQNMVDFVSRFAPRLASRMVPSFAPSNTEQGPSPEEMQLINNAFTQRNNPAAIGATNPLNNVSMTGTGPYAENFAEGGSFTVKNPMYDINYGMLADGIYGAGMKAATFIDSMNRGIDPANKFNNTRIENVQGTAEPMTEGLYDEWGRFIPNDLGAKVLPGTGDKSAEYAGRDNTIFGGTKVFARGGGIHINPAHEGDFTAKANGAGMSVQEYATKVLSAPEGQYDAETRKQANFARNASHWKKENGGSYNVGDEFDLDDEEEARIAQQLKAAGYTFKRINK